MPRIVYMGTPEVALPPLQALLGAGYEVVQVATRPDRPAGRSRRPQPSPVKVFCQEQGLPVWQPPTLRTAEAVGYLRALQPDLIVVTAFGQILPPSVLDLPPYGCLNLHFSLLPRHRGAAPVAAAILAGEAETGVTLMQMDAGLDTGPILAQEVVPLHGRERRGELSTHLAELAADLLRRTLPAWLAGEIFPRPQDESQATYSRILRKEDGRVDWSRPAAYVERMVRAYDPWPGTHTLLHGRRLRLWQASVFPSPPRPAPPGTVLLEKDALLVVTGEGLLRLEEVQLEGKRRLDAATFLRGQRDLAGVRLG